MPVIDTPQNVPELLYLLHGDPTDLAEALAGMRAADVAEALRDLHPDAASKVMAALPFDLAVQVFDEPELEGHRCPIIEQMGEKVAAPLIDAMSADQQADLFRELPERERPRFLKVLDAPTRETLNILLRYRPDTAGGIMTTSSWPSRPTGPSARRSTTSAVSGGRRKRSTPSTASSPTRSVSRTSSRFAT